MPNLNSLRRKRIKMILSMIRKEKNRKNYKLKTPYHHISYPQITNIESHHKPISEEEQIRLLNNENFIQSLPKHQVNPSSLQLHSEKKKIKIVRIEDNHHKPIEEDIYLDKIISYPKIEEILHVEKNNNSLESIEPIIINTSDAVTTESSEVIEQTKVDSEKSSKEEMIKKIEIAPSIIENPFILKREGPKVQVYGAFNTGTNLMVKLLNNLLQTNIPKEGSTRKWKHTLIVKNFPRLFHICMIKNPFSWFQSVIKESYLIEWDKKKKLLHQPVLMRGEGNPQRFSSIAKLWLHYYITYLEFSKKNKYNVLVIPFEEMIYDTDNLYKFVSDIFKIPLPNNYTEIKEKTMARPAKPHGHCHTLNQVKEKTKLEFLFSKYSKEDVMRFFQDVPLHLILPKHRQLWNLDDWFNHFITRSEVSNAPSIHP